MTTATHELDDASRYAWACSVFELKPGASPLEIRAAIMSHIDDADFVPPVAWRQAIWLLCDPRSPKAWPQNGYDAFREATENSLVEEVDQFAAEFFALPRGPRRTKWAQLLAQVAAFPRLRARLISLQLGLDVESTKTDGQDQQDSILVDRIRKLFVLKPGAQAIQRREWLAAMTGDWKLAVRKVRAKYPKLAQLDDEFLTALEGSNRSAAAVQSSASVAAHLHVAEEFVSRLNVSAGGPAPSRIQSRPRPISHPQEGVRASGAAIAIAVGVILGIFRSMNSDHTNYQYTPPKVPSVRPIDEILRQTRDPSNFPPRWPVDGSNPDEGSSADRNAEALKIIERLVREKYHKSSPSNDDPPFLPPVPVPPQPNPEGRKTQGFRFPPQRSERPLLSPTLIGPIDSRPASPQGSPR